MNLLITGAWQHAEESIPAITAQGHHVLFMQQEKDELPCHEEWVEGVIGNAFFLFHPISRFSNLHYIQLTSAGYDRVPMEYIQRHQIEIRNANGVYSIPLAEHAVAGVLWLYRKADFFRENQRQHRWVKNRQLKELSGKTVLIIGCGHVGSACAARFRAFGCEVHGFALSPHEDDSFSVMHPLSELDAWLPQADVVILALPLTEQTRAFMNGHRLSLLNAEAVLVNLARGAIVEEHALVEVIPKIGGAILDVFEEEPLSPESPLWDFENVLLTPHNSFVSDGNEERLKTIIMENLQKNK